MWLIGRIADLALRFKHVHSYSKESELLWKESWRINIQQSYSQGRCATKHWRLQEHRRDNEAAEEHKVFTHVFRRQELSFKTRGQTISCGIVAAYCQPDTHAQTHIHTLINEGDTCHAYCHMVCEKNKWGVLRSTLGVNTVFKLHLRHLRLARGKSGVEA